MKKHIILMADIVKSRDLDGKMAMAQLKKITTQVNEYFGDGILSPLTITLGDEFQGIVRSLSDVIQIIISFEELLIMFNAGFKMRYVVVFGEIETPVNPVSAHEMLGEGLSFARTSLNQLKKSSDRFFMQSFKPDFDELFNPSLKLYQYFVDRWSQKDYALISSFLKYDDYKIVAKKNKKDVSLMWRRRKSLNIDEYQEIKKLLILLSKTKIS